MARISDYLIDALLAKLDTEATHIYICSTEPTTFTEASVTYALGVKAGPAISAPGAHTPTGREVTVSAISDGSVSGTGTAGYYAITDNTNSRLLYTKAMSSTQSVTSGNTWSSPSFKMYMLGVV